MQACERSGANPKPLTPMSPICLFVYKRFDTTRLMLESLMNCPECSDSDLYVFMDAARSEKDIEEESPISFRGTKRI